MLATLNRISEFEQGALSVGVEGEIEMTSRSNDLLSSCDPEEMVTARYLTGGPLKLGTVVKRTLELPQISLQLIEIFRGGEPPILYLNDIRMLAERADFKSYIAKVKSL